MELNLLQARLATDDGDRDTAVALFDETEVLLSSEGVTSDDQLCYRARLTGQRAYHLTKPNGGQAPQFEAARKLFDGLEEDPNVPFACFRRNCGLAYCTWKAGDPVEGARLARLAAENAGDGGFVRFRIMALNILSQIVEPAEGRAINQRAARLAKQLEDEDLLRRVHLRTEKLEG
jgi:hypothetical protein